MKNSFSFPSGIVERYNDLVMHDRNEIDNPEMNHPSRINYYDRLNKVIELIQLYYPIAENIKIADFGCAQGNFSLLLAELGYIIYAVDINPKFLEYSKLKYEKGNIHWVVADISKTVFAENSLDIIIMIEVIEHCAYPEDIIKNVLQCLKSGGILIMTTPNGTRLKTKVRSFKSIITYESRKFLEKKQFGPEGNDHLFLFGIGDIQKILPNNAKIIDKGYTGGSIIVTNHYLKRLLTLLPHNFIKRLLAFLHRFPLINKKTSNGIYWVAKKK